MICKYRLLLIASSMMTMVSLNNGYAQSLEIKVSNPTKLQSAHPFQETVERLRSALEAKGFTIFSEIDQQRAARQAGLDMPPTTLLIYGNPKGGTALMIAAPDFALELPLKVLVREEDGKDVRVLYTPSSQLEGKFGLPAGMAAKLAGAEPVIAAALGAKSN